MLRTTLLALLLLNVFTLAQWTKTEPTAAWTSSPAPFSVSCLPYLASSSEGWVVVWVAIYQEGTYGYDGDVWFSTAPKGDITQGLTWTTPTILHRNFSISDELQEFGVYVVTDTKQNWITMWQEKYGHYYISISTVFPQEGSWSLPDNIYTTNQFHTLNGLCARSFTMVYTPGIWLLFFSDVDPLTIYDITFPNVINVMGMDDQLQRTPIYRLNQTDDINDYPLSVVTDGLGLWGMLYISNGMTIFKNLTVVMKNSYLELDVGGSFSLYAPNPNLLPITKQVLVGYNKTWTAIIYDDNTQLFYIRPTTDGGLTWDQLVPATHFITGSFSATIDPKGNCMLAREDPYNWQISELQPPYIYQPKGYDADVMTYWTEFDFCFETLQEGNNDIVTHDELTDFTNEQYPVVVTDGMGTWMIAVTTELNGAFSLSRAPLNVFVWQDCVVDPQQFCSQICQNSISPYRPKTCLCLPGYDKSIDSSGNEECTVSLNLPTNNTTVVFNFTLNNMCHNNDLIKVPTEYTYNISGDSVCALALLGESDLSTSVKDVNLTGALWIRNKIDITESFWISFSFYLRNIEGFAFVIHNDNKTIGLGGYGLGYQGLSNCVAVEFDVVYDEPIDGPAAVPHVSIQTRRNLPNLPNTTDSLDYTYTPQLSLDLQHNAILRYQDGRLSLFLDEYTYETVSTEMDLACFLNTTTAWIGFTASASRSDQVFLLGSWDMTRVCNFSKSFTSTKTCSDILSEFHLTKQQFESLNPTVSCNSSLVNGTLLCLRMAPSLEDICITDTPSGTITVFQSSPWWQYVVSPIVAIIIVLVACICLFAYFRKKSNNDEYEVKQLPIPVRWNYDHFHRSQSEWNRRDYGRYYSRPLVKDSEDWTRVVTLLNYLGGKGLPLLEVYAVHSPTLLNRFVHSRSILNQKYKFEKDLHFKKSWEDYDEGANKKALRRHVYKAFNKMAESYEWNRSEEVQIIPVVHVTSLATAWRIAGSGFSALAKYDEGFFGKGIYFTTNTIYSLIYFARNRKSAIMISYVLPGNVYPVIEHPNSEQSLLGHGISPYHSNYVLCQLDGMPCADTKPKIFDEIVIEQEGNVLPVYILCPAHYDLGPVYDKMKTIEDSMDKSTNLPTFAFPLSSDMDVPLTPSPKSLSSGDEESEYLSVTEDPKQKKGVVSMRTTQVSNNVTPQIDSGKLETLTIFPSDKKERVKSITLTRTAPTQTPKSHLGDTSPGAKQ